MRWPIERSNALTTDAALPIAFAVAVAPAAGVVDDELPATNDFDVDDCDDCCDVLAAPVSFGDFFDSATGDDFADDGLFKYFETTPLRFFKCLLGDDIGNLIGDGDAFVARFMGD